MSRNRKGRPNKPKTQARDASRDAARRQAVVPGPQEAPAAIAVTPVAKKEAPPREAVVLGSKDGFQITNKTYANVAEDLMGKYMGSYQDKRAKDQLTTTKLRSIYALITNVYVRVNTPEDYEGVVPDIQYIKVRMAYEAGRENSVKEFLTVTHLKDLVDSIGGFEQFGLYCRYAEALVAYFKFFNGKDK